MNRQRLWARQLRLEHENICFQHRIGLKMPTFEITNGRTTLGSWLASTKTIKIAARLIAKNPWDIVINVLKHEMAHQYADEVLRNQGPPHGPPFQKACELLGVLPAYRTASGRLPVASSPASSPVIDRVNKILGLARSGNHHEAETAMRKANELIKKHNLERLEQSGEAAYEYLVLKPGQKRLDAIKRQTVALLADFFFVEVIYSSQYEAEADETYKTIELLGTRENVALAGYVHDFVENQSKLLWRAYKNEHRAPQKLRRSYILGLLKGLRDKLSRPETASIKIKTGGWTTSSLVVAQDPELAKFTNLRFPRLRKIRAKGATIHKDTYAAGQQEGKKLVIHRPITEKAGNRGRLLGR